MLKEKNKVDDVHQTRQDLNMLLQLLFGFPCELEDSLLFEPAREEEKIEKEDEERRLFYVALTRAKEELIIYTQKSAKSKFINEIKKYIEYKELGY